jgi:hypothetical protein
VGVGAGIDGICSPPLLLFLGLVAEQLRQERQRALIEMRRDADVLQAGTEFVTDLFVERFRELGAD